MLTLATLHSAVAVVPSVGESQDLKLSYRSKIDNTDQPYRVYVPSRYRSDRPNPVALALHGTGHNENTFLDDPRYSPERGVRKAAEQTGMLVVVPYGRGNTEFRGIGENDVFCVLEEVQRRFNVDVDRIYLTGHSMGGLGSAYLGLHYPDKFAAFAPLAPAYSFPWLAANAGHLPSLWVLGEKDESFFRIQSLLGIERMKRLGCPVEVIDLPDENHFGPTRDFIRVFEFLLRHRRVAHVQQFTFEVDTPLHPRAYWATVETIAVPGRMAVVKGRAPTPRQARFELENVAALTFWPDPEVFAVAESLEVWVDETRAFTGIVPRGQEVRLHRQAGGWVAALQPRREIDPTIYRTHPIAFAPEAIDISGTESRLANWITDAMRTATGADVALYNRTGYRGLPIPAGTVDLVDVIQCTRPFDQYLVTTRLSGRELVEILDDNIQTPAAQSKRNRLVQLSGGCYTFNRRLPPGKRIVASSFEPDTIYTVALEGQTVERDEKVYLGLAGRSATLRHEMTDIPLTLALYRHAASAKELRAPREGRVQEIE